MGAMMLVLLSLHFSFRNTVVQNRNQLLLAGPWQAVQNQNASGGFEAVDTGKLNLFFGKERKPLLSIQADLSKSSAWLDFMVKDTAGNVRLQSLLQVIDDGMIQWQFFDSTRANHSTSASGEIFFLRRKQ